jgi:hypothetical protein
VSSAAPRDSAAFEVREALAEPGCAVCRLALRSVSRLLQSIAYEQVNDIALRKELRRARGFCNRHAYQWLREVRSVLGTALIYRDVLLAALRELEAPANGQRGGLLRGVRDALGPPPRRGRPPCPACRAELEAETRYLEALVAVVAAGADPPAVCRRHVVTAVRLGSPGVDLIVEKTRKDVEALVGELDEVIRKEDYRFRHEERTEGERSAPSRAIAWAAGADGLADD